MNATTANPTKITEDSTVDDIYFRLLELAAERDRHSPELANEIRIAAHRLQLVDVNRKIAEEIAGV